MTARSARPISRWISTVRPFCLPALASRAVRSPVEAGSSEYSAVIQPRPRPRSQRGTLLLDRGGAEHARLPLRVEHRAVRLLEEVGDDLERAQLVGPAAVLPAHAGGRLELREGDVLDLAERELEEALAERAEELRVAGGQEAVGALAALAVLDPLAGERLGHLARGLLGGEDERHAAPEDALEDRPDQRVVRAAEDDRVDLGVLERRGVLAHGLGRLLAERARRSRSAARAAGRRPATSRAPASSACTSSS